MNLDDRMRIDTPEGVSIEVTLAGLGSRFGAALVDLLIQGVLLLTLTLALSLAGSVVSGDLGVFLLGIGTLLIVVIVIGYYVIFEALNGGRTPGKAAMGIRVATVDGTALGLGAVTLRTLMRLVDFLPGFYAAGAIAIAVTARNQRLGDIVANTIVIRHRLPSVPTDEGSPAGAPIQGWDVSAVTASEVALIRRYLQRRSDLTAEADRRLASDLAGRIRPRVPAGSGLDDKEFLEQVLTEKVSR
ncbi:MAG TPA: RDD family protein [Acidimicrobiia bacterium]|nr:RDD family protein [Acidimicrobiia bacterium]